MKYHAPDLHGGASMAVDDPLFGFFDVKIVSPLSLYLAVDCRIVFLFSLSLHPSILLRLRCR